MNTLTGKTVGVVYNTRTADLSCLASLPVVYWAAPDATFVDVSAGGSHAAIDTLINAALTDNTLDYAICLTTITDTYTTTGVPDYDNVATLWGKLKTANKGTEILTGTAPGNASTTILTVAAYPAAANDAYNGLMLEFTAGTHSGQIAKIIDSTKATPSVTIGGAGVSGGNFAATDVYHIYDAQEYLWVVQDGAYAQAGATYFYSAKNALTRGCYKLWELCHPDNTPPLFITTIGNYLYHEATGTASAGAATTITDAGAGWTVNAYAGMYVYILSGTGLGQYAQIVSNDTDTLTCQYFNGDYGKLGYKGMVIGGNAAWTTNPDGTSVYKIVAQYTDILKPEYLQMYIRTSLNKGLTGAQLLLDAKSLIDDNGMLANYTYGSPVQNLYFLDEILVLGKAMYDSAIVTGLTALV